VDASNLDLGCRRGTEPGGARLTAAVGTPDAAHPEQLCYRWQWGTTDAGQDGRL